MFVEIFSLYMVSELLFLLLSAEDNNEQTASISFSIYFAYGQ